LHDASCRYGASKSVQLLISNLKGFEIDVAIPKQLLSFKRMGKEKKFFRCDSEVSIRKKFNNNINNIYSIIMIFDWWCNIVSEHAYKKKNIYGFLENILSKVDYIFLKIIVFFRKYDLIHLNSTVSHFYSRLSSTIPISMHVREGIVTNPKPNFIHSLNLLEGAISIDNAIARSIPKQSSLKRKVVLNPFDMKFDVHSKEIDLGFLYSDFVTVSYVGRLDNVKGYDFVINSFQKCKNQSLKLLIFGSGRPESVKFVKEIASKNKNIHFAGFVDDVKSIYQSSDYVVRGEDHLALGRTVYEAVLSQTPIILPVKNENLSEDFIEYEKHKSLIYQYEARNYNSLSKVFDSLHKRKNKTAKGQNNINEHISSMKQFWKSLL
jgi:glycosyltransferase involved in cell wall biosynthesis